MKRPHIICLLTVLAGTVGLALRLWLFAGIDELGLLPASHPADTLTLVLAGAVAVLLFVNLLLSPKTDHRVFVSLPVGAAGSLAGAVGCVLLYMSGALSTTALPAMILGTGSFLVLSFFQFQAKKPPLLLPLLITVSQMLLCYGQYGLWSIQTQAQQYLFNVLASVALILYSLHLTVRESGERNYRQVFFFGQTALLSCLMSMNTTLWPWYLMMALWVVSDLFFQPYAFRLPEGALRCIRRLEEAGYEAWAVGGCVRDNLLGLEPGDYDLCTNATPDKLCELFSQYPLVRSGEKHGTIGVVMGKAVYEITTYRTEGGYQDNRHPDWVEFVSSVREDLSRRDFTVNAMAYNPRKGYLDPFGGQQDLSGGILRTVGDPETRFREDSLRILRGMRFAVRFELEPEEATLKAMEELAPLTDTLARERVYSELCKFLCRADAASILRFAPILTQVLPELAPSVGFLQHSPYHAYDVFTHTAHVVAGVPEDEALRWAALLHDAGKPACFTQDETGRGHFKGHAAVSAQIAGEVLLRLKAPTALREQVVFLITHHMDDLICEKGAMGRKLSRCGEDSLRKLIALQRADFGSKGTGKKQKDPGFDKMEQLIEELLEENACLSVRDLALSGHDLLELGFEPGPALGDCQKYLLELVLNETVPTTTEALSQKAKQFLEQ